MAEDHADVIALRALAWLAGDDDLWQRFLAATGADGAALADVLARALAGSRDGLAAERSAGADPGTLAGVLDFVLQDDARVLAFAADAGLPPEAPMRARQKLGGGDVHWT